MRFLDLTSSRLLRPLLFLVAAIAIACGGQTATPTPPAPTAPPTSFVPVTPAPPIDTPSAVTPIPATPLPGATASPPTATPTPTGPVGTPTPARSFTPDVGMAAQLGPQLQAVLDQQQADGGIPGIGATITFPDGSIWSSGSGNAIASPAEPATGDTPFVVGSITKTFITAAIMQLADAGQLSIDDPLSNWVPDFPNAQNITIRELLHHTSGIYDYFDYPTYNTQVFLTMQGHSWTPQEILSTFVGAPYFPPGTGYHYSNTNFILLGLVVENITGQQ
ncbi:MAG TPA: serine hydrolase domain-containing protein, partial [Candidatus Limnocylindrales bacterium]